MAAAPASSQNTPPAPVLTPAEKPAEKPPATAPAPAATDSPAAGSPAAAPETPATPPAPADAPHADEHEAHSDREEGSVDESILEDDLIQLVQQLEQQRDQEAGQGRYLNAQAIQDRLTQIKASEEYGMVMKIANNLADQQSELEMRKLRTIQLTEESYEQRQAAFAAESERLVSNLQERQQQELAEFWAACDARPERPKFSNELLNLRQRELSLARTHQYAKAHELQTQADKMEAWEMEKFRHQQHEADLKREEIIKARHAKEMDTLQERISSFGRESDVRRQRAVTKVFRQLQVTRRQIESTATKDKHRGQKYFAQNFQNPRPNQRTKDSYDPHRRIPTMGVTLKTRGTTTGTGTTTSGRGGAGSSTPRSPKAGTTRGGGRGTSTARRGAAK